MEGMDLEMLAPYISMDDDFQLTFLSGLPEESDKPSSESSAGTSAVPLSRKRYDRHDLITCTAVTAQCLDFKCVQRMAPEERP